MVPAEFAARNSGRIESILINGSGVQPRLAILKPLFVGHIDRHRRSLQRRSSDRHDRSALGSMVAQFHVTSAERKTLLGAGAAEGRSATFALAIPAVMLAQELLLFEWKPRSPVAVAFSQRYSRRARRHILGLGLIAHQPAFLGPEGLLGCAICGLLAGVPSVLLTGAVTQPNPPWATGSVSLSRGG
jgi:hypothetical protein